MAKYFKNIKSLEDLKAQFRALARRNHPDVGGDVEVMKIINCEYDALFTIWKNIHEMKTGETTAETADSTRRRFYTQNGWEGHNHNWNRSLKEVAQIVRAYVKEKYPTYKFSVRTHYASMCQELTVELKESPIEIYKTYEDLTESDKNELLRIFKCNGLWHLNCWNENEQEIEFKKIWNNKGNCYKCLNETTKSVINDVDSFVKSYNYSDCDGMIDYFDVDFYYFGCVQNNGANIKIVPRTARLQTEKKAASKTLTKKITVAENHELNGIEVTFTEKPDNATLETLKAAKFRWHRAKKLWYAKKTPETTAVVQKLSFAENEKSMRYCNKTVVTI